MVCAKGPCREIGLPQKEYVTSESDAYPKYTIQLNVYKAKIATAHTMGSWSRRFSKYDMFFVICKKRKTNPNEQWRETFLNWYRQSPKHEVLFTRGQSAIAGCVWQHRSHPKLAAGLCCIYMCHQEQAEVQLAHQGGPH